jgi:hypothetical protein
MKYVAWSVFRDGKDLLWFFAGYAVSAAFIVTLPWMLFDRRVRFLMVQGAICFGGFLLVAQFLVHYAAPVTATLFALFTQGLRHLRQSSRNDVRRGIALAPPQTTDTQKGLPIENRARIETQLDGMPENDLVVVRYSPQHDVATEWVYNRADIDKATVVGRGRSQGWTCSPC